MVIRDLEVPDLAALLRLYRQLHLDDAPLPDAQTVDRIWQQVLQQPGHRVFGGFIGDALVCTCTLTLTPNLTRGARPYGLIENVVTDAAHRRQQLGRTMLGHALDQAWAAGCYKVMLMTGRLDAGTTAFYTAAGFDGTSKNAFVAKPPAAGG